MSDMLDENKLSSPDYIKVLLETNDSLMAMKAMENKSWTSARFLNMKGYHYNRKKSKYIVYQIVPRNEGTTIYKIRPDNFYADSLARPTELYPLYSNYQVSRLNNNDEIYLIQPKVVYDYARPFVRIIFYDKNQKRERALTYNDFSETKTCLTDSGYLVGLKSPEVTSYFKNFIPSYKLIFIGFDHHIKWIRTSKDNSSRLLMLNSDNKNIMLSIQQPLGCSICDWEFFDYTVKLDLSGELLDVEVQKQAKGQNISEELLFSRLKNQ